MRRRSDELRARDRKIFGWSYAAAALLMGFVFFVWAPDYSIEPMAGDPEIQREEAPSDATSAVFVQVLFGPPTILIADGVERTEPATRVLEVGSVVQLRSGCVEDVALVQSELTGSVRLRINPAGEASVTRVVEGTGSACGDELIGVVAGALLYRWLPSEEFPPPVDLVQPVAIVDVAEAL